MLTLNLISEEQKKEIKLKHLYGFIKKLDLIFLIIIIIVSILLLVARIIMQNQFNKIVEQTSLITRNSQSYNTKVREINSKINSVNQIQDGFVYWTTILDDLASKAGAGVKTGYIKVSQADQSIVVRGQAKTRDGLLAFKDALEKSGLYSQINLPVSSILEKNDINFEISAKINLERLK